MVALLAVQPPAACNVLMRKPAQLGLATSNCVWKDCYTGDRQLREADLGQQPPKPLNRQVRSRLHQSITQLPSMHAGPHHLTTMFHRCNRTNRQLLPARVQPSGCCVSPQNSASTACKTPTQTQKYSYNVLLVAVAGHADGGGAVLIALLLLLALWHAVILGVRLLRARL